MPLHPAFIAAFATSTALLHSARPAAASTLRATFRVRTDRNVLAKGRADAPSLQRSTASAPTRAALAPRGWPVRSSSVPKRADSASVVKIGAEYSTEQGPVPLHPGGECFSPAGGSAPCTPAASFNSRGMLFGLRPHTRRRFAATCSLRSQGRRSLRSRPQGLRPLHPRPLSRQRTPGDFPLT